MSDAKYSMEAAETSNYHLTQCGFGSALSPAHHGAELGGLEECGVVSDSEVRAEPHKDWRRRPISLLQPAQAAPVRSRHGARPRARRGAAVGGRSAGRL